MKLENIKRHKFRKFVLITVISILAFMVVIAGFTWNTISAEKEEVSVQGRFVAFRNEVGIFKIKANSVADLGFAFGCVQAHDRLFQTELMRRLGAGRLTEWFGEMALTRDRLMRFSAEVARWEWKKISEDPEFQLTKILLENYVAGRKACITSAPTPLEFRLLRQDISAAADWEPWEILAITRAHASDFSYDYRDEVGRHALQTFFGDEYSRLLTPPEDPQAPALYDQVKKEDLVSGLLDKNLQKAKSLWPNHAFFPEILAAKNQSDLQIKQATKITSKHQEGFDIAGLGSFTGASNAWVAKQATDSKAYLCNDTHLGFLWPSTLYPIEYELNTGNGNVVKASGFNLPGVPSLNIGRVIVEKNGVRENILEWGITIANFIDTQNLIKLDGHHSEKRIEKLQRFLIIDPNTHEKKEMQFKETWTNFGPKVDEFTDWMGADPKEPEGYALFWPAVRKQISAVQFFALRMVNGSDGLLNDFRYWQYPSVNFNWLQWEKGKGIYAGHKMTGTTILEKSPERRHAHNTFLSENEAMELLKTEDSDRPYIFKRIENSDEFFYATGNQRIYSGDLGKAVAYHWHEGSRAKRLVELKDKILKDPTSGQADLTSIEIKRFLSLVLPLVNEGMLCEGLPGSCKAVVSGISEFNSVMSKDDWRPTIVSLWEREVKVGLWKVDPRTQNDPTVRRDWMELHKWWDRSGQSTHALFDILSSTEKQAFVEKHLQKSFKLVLSEAFKRSFDSLAKINPQFLNWKWSEFHRVAWQHPFLKIPGTVGKLMKSFVFPEGPEVDGSTDTPNVQQYYWTAQDPTDFSAIHGPVMRTCMTLSQDGTTSMKLANVTGVSGNPFSKYAKNLSQDYYFQQKYFMLNE